MTRRLLPTLLLPALIVLATGCGGGSKSSSSSASPPAASTAASTAATTSTSPQVTVPSAVSNTAAVQRAVASCRSLVKATPTLSAEAKAKAEGICDKAAHGDIAGARKAAKEVCTELINSTGVSGALKERALASCKAVK